MQVFVQTLVGGISLGAIYALVAMGFSLVYRTMGLVNFAHGNVVMIGAYLASTFYLSVRLPFALAMVVAIAVTGLIGVVIERVLRPLENKDFDLMLNFEGNTAPYLLYAYTRVAGVFRKLGKDFSEVEGQIVLEATHEHELAAKLAQFGEVLNNVAEKGTPHILCTYLYDVAGLFSSFYENCPILAADTPAQMQSRLRLAALTGRTLKQGLELLGLETLERM